MTTTDQQESDAERFRSRLRLVLMVAVPFGAVVGALLAGEIYGALARDDSHSGAIAVAGVGALGLLVGAVLSPVLVWFLYVRSRWK